MLSTALFQLAALPFRHAFDRVTNHVVVTFCNIQVIFCVQCVCSVQLREESSNHLTIVTIYEDWGHFKNLETEKMNPSCTVRCLDDVEAIGYRWL
jgi:hypothetical protein